MEKLKYMVIGAHPDDCDFRFSGTAFKLKAQGHEIMYLSMTNGCSGHHLTPGPAMTARRYAEAQAVAKLIGITYKLTDIPDGALTTDLRYRDLLMREIRAFEPDLIFTHRPYDYHPDHRNTGTLVMDCSYLMRVPYVVPDSPPLKKSPYIFYTYDHFTFPGPFVPDMVVSVDDVMDKKTAVLDCHVSQVYEWLPWVGGYAEEVPPESDPKGRFRWLKTKLLDRKPDASGKYREILEKRYGAEIASKTNSCEAFQLCEYGAQLSYEEMEKLFPL